MIKILTQIIADKIEPNAGVGVLLVVFVALRAHVAGQIVHRARDRPRVALVGQAADHTLDVFAVVLIGDPPLGIGHPAGRCGQLLTRGLRVGRVHIELEIRHDEKSSSSCNGG